MHRRRDEWDDVTADLDATFAARALEENVENAMTLHIHGARM